MPHLSNTQRLARGSVLVFFVVALSASACGPAIAPRELDGLHARCSARAPEAKTVRRSADVGMRPERPPVGTPVVIYGAEWCEVCHVAASYLARQRIPFVMRNVEEDVGARRDMKSALASAGLQDVRSLPIIDVRGTVVRGFEPCIIEDAWADAR
jgi:glutaredoxin